MDSVRMMKRLAQGDADAVRAFYEQYGRPVFTVCYRALGDRVLAEDATQATFLQAWRAAETFDVSRDPAPWLYAIARRAAVDVYRRERRHRVERLDREDDPEIVVLPQSFEATWEAWEVRTAVERLTPEERLVVESTFFLGMTHEETAQRLGVPIGTVKSRAHRAHRRLASMLAHVSEATA
jgi:RNA polymerase sigma-70 factor (ECF subfamily)